MIAHRSRPAPPLPEDRPAAAAGPGDRALCLAGYILVIFAHWGIVALLLGLH